MFLLRFSNDFLSRHIYIYIFLIPTHFLLFFTLSVVFSPGSVDPNDQKKTACYDIDVEVEDPLKSQMSSFLLSTANQQEIASLDNKVRSQASQNTRSTHTPQLILSYFDAVCHAEVRSEPPSWEQPF